MIQCIPNSLGVPELWGGCALLVNTPQFLTQADGLRLLLRRRPAPLVFPTEEKTFGLKNANKSKKVQK